MIKKIILLIGIAVLFSGCSKDCTTDWSKAPVEDIGIVNEVKYVAGTNYVTSKTVIFTEKKTFVFKGVVPAILKVKACLLTDKCGKKWFGQVGLDYIYGGLD